MFTPFSFRYEPWSRFDTQSYHIITDDYCHESPVTIKAIARADGSEININQQLSFVEGRNGYISKTGIKLWIPLISQNYGFIYLQSNNNRIKIHYDNSLRKIDNKFTNICQFINVYGSFQTNKNFNNQIFQFGVNLLAKNWMLENRLEMLPNLVNLNGFPNLTIGNKFTWMKNQFSFNWYHNYKIHQKVLANNAVRIGYQHQNHEIFFRAYQNQSRAINNFPYNRMDSYFKKFIMDYVVKIKDNIKLGLQVRYLITQCEWNPFSTLIPKVCGVINLSTSTKGEGKKLKISSDKSVSFCYKKKINQNSLFGFGFQVSDIGNRNQGKTGLLFQYNSK